MKSPSSSAATLKFASPEINVGLDAARGSSKKKAAPAVAPAPMEKMAKNKKMIMPGAPDAKPFGKKDKNPAKRLPKRRK